jgi:hypothetical protein
LEKACQHPTKRGKKLRGDIPLTIPWEEGGYGQESFERINCKGLDIMASVDRFLQLDRNQKAHQGPVVFDLQIRKSLSFCRGGLVRSPILPPHRVEKPEAG